MPRSPTVKLFQTGAKSKLTSLTDRQRKFVCEYLVDFDATRASIAAGYKSSHVMPTKLLKNPKIARVIGNLQKMDVERLELSREEVLKNLYYCITRTSDDFKDDDGRIQTDLNKLNERAKHCIDSIKQRDHFNKNGELTHTDTELKLVPKLGAIDMGMKHKGLYAQGQDEDQNIQELKVAIAITLKEHLEDLRENPDYAEFARKQLASDSQSNDQASFNPGDVRIIHKQGEVEVCEPSETD